MTNINKIPGGVYLCQVNENVSCAACCGIYNIPAVFYDTLMALLTYRTEKFVSVPRTMDAILAFKADIEARETLSYQGMDRPFPKFHHCPYIGLIGENHLRTGCLLHPLADGNNGVDFRGLSFYGGMACHMYFCPTHHKLSEIYKEIVRDISQDWYGYGLVITETKLLDAFFREVETRISRPLKTQDIVGNKTCTEIVREFLNLKSDWEFRTPGKGAGNYFFEDGLYARIPVCYDDVGESSSQYDVIFQELDSSFDSPEALHRAENLLDQLFERLILGILNQ